MQTTIILPDWLIFRQSKRLILFIRQQLGIRIKYHVTIQPCGYGTEHLLPPGPHTASTSLSRNSPFDSLHRARDCCRQVVLAPVACSIDPIDPPQGPSSPPWRPVRYHASLWRRQVSAHHPIIPIFPSARAILLIRGPDSFRTAAFATSTRSWRRNP